MCVAGTASSHVLLGHNLKKPLMFSYCDLSLCIYHMWSDVFRVQDTGYTLQKENCSFNKDLCHVSCTCTTVSMLPSHVVHNHNISLSCGPRHTPKWL